MSAMKPALLVIASFFLGQAAIAAAPEPKICPMLKYSTEDFRLREENLTAKLAEEGLGILKKYEGKKVDGELALSAFNASLWVQGYAMKQAALRNPSKKADFCAWLEHGSREHE